MVSGGPYKCVWHITFLRCESLAEKWGFLGIELSLFWLRGLGVEQGIDGKGGIGLGENLCHLFLPLPHTYLLSGSDESVIPPVGSTVWISITTPLGRTGRGSVKDWSTFAKLFYLLCATWKRRYCLKIPADVRPSPVLQHWLFSYCQWADRCH